MPEDAADLQFMAMALSLARRGLGSVWPNPAVGCVLVAARQIVGRGWTQPGGRPHAETEALRRAGARARGATAYVTLEPCDHHGVTGPCSQALLEAGIARAVVAVKDPDPRVAGRGIARLRASGVAISEGVGEIEASALNRGFLLRIGEGRPLITLKLATTLDGRIATASGDSKWITGLDARRAAHRLRATHDAVLVGLGTVLADDPALTCRLPGLVERSPVRVIADSRLRLPAASEVVRTAHTVPTWVLTASDGGDPAKRQLLSARAVQVIEVASDAAGRPEPRAMAQALAARGITRVLLEGGGELAAAFLRAGLIDEVAWFYAPKLLGGDGRAAVGRLDIARVADGPAFCLHQLSSSGDDVLARFRRQR